MDWAKLPLEPRHLGVPAGASKMICNPMVRLAQTVQRFKISTISKRNETSIHLSLVPKEYHWVRPKWFLSLCYIWHKPCTYLALTLILSPNELKQNSTWPTSPSPGNFHWVRPKWFLSPWYVRGKACTYLASRLALSPNGRNRASTWASSPRSITRCVQNDFWTYGMFGANRATILHRH
jgi:hypothetical protein